MLRRLVLLAATAVLAGCCTLQSAWEYPEPAACTLPEPLTERCLVPNLGPERYYLGPDYFEVPCPWTEQPGRPPRPDPGEEVRT